MSYSVWFDFYYEASALLRFDFTWGIADTWQDKGKGVYFKVSGSPDDRVGGERFGRFNSGDASA